jgi:hypothetical protein
MGSGGEWTAKILVFNSQFEVWVKIRSGNMREGGNKKRDVGMIYEGRGKGKRGKTQENAGWGRKDTAQLILDGDKQKVKSGKSKNGAEPSPLHSHRLRTPRLVKIGARIVQRGA